MNASQRYLFSRIGSAFLTLAILVSLTFFLLRLIPGGPFDDGDFLPLETKRQLEAAFGLDRPLWEQYLKWLFDLAQGDLRASMQYPEMRVTELLFPAAKTSLVIGGFALLVALALGGFMGVLGVWANWKKYSFIDKLMQFVMLCLLSMPSYVVATFLILIFAFRLKWLPLAFLDSGWSYILPILAISLKPAALFARYLSASLLEVLKQDYIRTAKSKGVLDMVIIGKHAMRNSLISLITVVGTVSAQLLTGSVVVETVFQVPGLGRQFIQSILARDYTLAIGATIILGLVVITTNLLADLVLMIVDPRISFDSGANT